MDRKTQEDLDPSNETLNTELGEINWWNSELEDPEIDKPISSLT